MLSLPRYLDLDGLPWRVIRWRLWPAGGGQAVHIEVYLDGERVVLPATNADGIERTPALALLAVLTRQVGRGRRTESSLRAEFDREILPRVAAYQRHKGVDPTEDDLLANLGMAKRTLERRRARAGDSTWKDVCDAARIRVVSASFPSG